MQAILKRHSPKEILQAVGGTIALLVMLDLLILFASLGQVVLEGRTGHWNSFWTAQAKVVVNLLQ